MNVAERARVTLRAEGRLAVRVHRDWRTYILPGILVPFGIAYWREPNDLIADSTPYIGRLDDIACFVVILLLCRLAAGYIESRQSASGPHQASPDKAHAIGVDWVRGCVARVPDFRVAGLAGASFVLGRLLFRLALGRWPTRHQLLAFRSAMVRNVAPVPPLLRGLAVMPEGKEQIGWLLQLSHVFGGNDSCLLIPADVAASARRLRIPPNIGNPLCVWTGPDVAFLHFEKAAGTSFVREFTRLFHPGQIDPDPFRSMPPHLLTRFVGTAGATAARYPFVWGHYDVPSVQRLGADRVAYTILREPRARILSLYWYWRSVDPAVLRSEGGNHTVREAHRLGLLDFLRSDDAMLRDYIDNVYARRLTGIYASGAGRDLLRADPSRALDQALLALAQFPVVGVTERLSESFACLGQYLGFTPPAAAPRANVTVDNAAHDPRFRVIERERITAAIEAELVMLTRLDRALYSAAVQHLSAALVKGNRALAYDHARGS